ncbi:hypothetical protein BC829DRAFT_419755 [Chytridium lagenaria]|nr:hypothetical protein BC829DRAFT_419755 [Chytridium lagenaria]
MDSRSIRWDSHGPIPRIHSNTLWHPSNPVAPPRRQSVAVRQGARRLSLVGDPDVAVAAETGEGDVGVRRHATTGSIGKTARMAPRRMSSFFQGLWMGHGKQERQDVEGIRELGKSDVEAGSVDSTVTAVMNEGIPPSFSMGPSVGDGKSPGRRSTISILMPRSRSRTVKEGGGGKEEGAVKRRSTIGVLQRTGEEEGKGRSWGSAMGGGGGERTFRVVCVGDFSCGKSSLLYSRRENEFPLHAVPSTMEPFDTIVALGRSKAPRRIRLHLVDTISPPCKGRPDPLSPLSSATTCPPPSAPVCAFTTPSSGSVLRRKGSRKGEDEEKDVYRICGETAVAEGGGEVGGADVVMLCFNVASRKTFESVRNGKRRLRGIARIPRFVLVGCKVDLREDREALMHSHIAGLPMVSFQEGYRLAKEIGAKSYAECSSLRLENITPVFEQVARVALLATTFFIGSLPQALIGKIPTTACPGTVTSAAVVPPPTSIYHKPGPASHAAGGTGKKFSVPFISQAATSAPTRGISPLALALTSGWGGDGVNAAGRRRGRTASGFFGDGTAEDDGNAVVHEWAPCGGTGRRLSQMSNSASSSLCWTGPGGMQAAFGVGVVYPPGHGGHSPPMSPVGGNVTTELSAVPTQPVPIVAPPRWHSVGVQLQPYGHLHPSPPRELPLFLTPAPRSKTGTLTLTTGETGFADDDGWRKTSACSSSSVGPPPLTARTASSESSFSSESSVGSLAGGGAKVVDVQQQSGVGGWAGALVRRLSGRKSVVNTVGERGQGSAGVWRRGSKRQGACFDAPVPGGMVQQGNATPQGSPRRIGGGGGVGGMRSLEVM